MSHHELYDGVPFEAAGGRHGVVHVVGLDGTTPSLAALRYALEQAYTNGGEVHAVYAYPTRGPTRQRINARCFADRASAALPETLREASALLVTASEGDPTSVLLAAARGTGGIVVGAPRALRDSQALGATVSAFLLAGGIPVTLVPSSWIACTARQQVREPSGGRQPGLTAGYARATARSALLRQEGSSAMTKYVYDFGEGSMRESDLLGGKGANLAEMVKLGLPVPPGFTITTAACRAYLASGHEPEELQEQASNALHRLEQRSGRRLGDRSDPLLVSVRSGGKFSMPGMMETVLDVGLNDESVLGLGRGQWRRALCLGLVPSAWSRCSVAPCSASTPSGSPSRLRRRRPLSV